MHSALRCAQGLTQTAYWGIGNGIGGLVSACLYDAMGGLRMFALMALSVWAGWGATTALQMVEARRHARTRSSSKASPAGQGSMSRSGTGAGADGSKTPLPSTTVVAVAVLLDEHTALVGLPTCSSTEGDTLYAARAECCPRQPLLAGLHSSTVVK